MENNYYPGFPHPAEDLTNFISGIDFVVVATRHKQVVRYSTPDCQSFCNWLLAHGVKNINKEAGTLVRGYYSRK